MNDIELAKACVKGDRKAQKELYDLHGAKMMSLCARYVNDTSTAEDILQEGFIKVFQKISQYTGKGPLGGWIRMIMINTALIHIRKEKKWMLSEEIDDRSDLEAKDFGVLEEMAADELMEIIQQLPTGYRTVFNLFVIEGYSHKEIGKSLGISESTSKTQFHKAKHHLRKAVIHLRQES